MDLPSNNAVAGSSSGSKPSSSSTSSPKTLSKSKPQAQNNLKSTTTPNAKKNGVNSSTSSLKPKGSAKSSTTTHTSHPNSNKLQPLPSPTSTSTIPPAGPSSPNQNPPSGSTRAGAIQQQPRGNKRKHAVVVQAPSRPTAPDPLALGEQDDPSRAGVVGDQIPGEVTLDGEERAGKKVRLSGMSGAMEGDLGVGEGGTGDEVDEVPDSLEQVGSGLASATTTVPGGMTKSNHPKPSTSHLKPPKTHTYHRIAPPKPTYPTSLPPSSKSLLKPGKPPQGSVPANNTSKPKNVILVSRNTGLGAYLRRCKGLLVDDGFATIHLHALSAAIPHSILILHSLLDILPFPQRCVSYELKSGSVKCFDEKKSLGGVVVKQKNKQVDSGEQGWEWEPVLFDDDDEEDGDEGGKGKGKGKEMTDGTTWQEKGDVRVRIVSSLEIIIRVGLDQKKKKTVEPQPGTLDPEVDKAERALQKLRDKAGTGPAGEGPAAGSTSSDVIDDAGKDLAESGEPKQPKIKVKKPNRPNQKQRKALRKKATEALGRGDELEDANAGSTTGLGETMDVDIEEGEANDQ